MKKNKKKVKKILTEGGGGGIIYKHSQESARSLKTEQETSISKETKKGNSERKFVHKESIKWRV